MVIDTVSNSLDDNDPDSEMREINERLVIAAIRHHELAETALRAEQRLNDVVSGINAVICEVPLHLGRPRFLSLPSKLFLGFQFDYWTSNDNFLAEIVHPSDRERVIDMLPLLLRRGDNFEYEFQALSATDDLVWMRNIVRLVYDTIENVPLLRCVIVDATQQKLASNILQKAYLRERNITDTLQRSLLFMPPEDSFPGLAVKTVYEAASEEALVGGDFWDTFAIDDNKVALVLGDVMGHGLPAAIFTAELKYALRGFVREHHEPGRILDQMNAYICETSRLYGVGLNEEGNDAPLCLIMAVVDTVTGEGTVAAAAMEPLLILRSGGEMEEVKVSGMQLGILKGEEYDEVTFQLERGDWIILATDGITEARSGSAFLGYAGLMMLASQGIHAGSLEGMGHVIIDGARLFAGGNLRDDACVLIAQRQ